MQTCYVYFIYVHTYMYNLCVYILYINNIHKYIIVIKWLCQISLFPFIQFFSHNPFNSFMRRYYYSYFATGKPLQSCPTLCDPTDGSPPGSPISGILQARTLQWVAISFSNAWKWKVKVKSLSCVRLLATPWTAAHQAPPSMGFSRQEYFIDE